MPGTNLRILPFFLFFNIVFSTAFAQGSWQPAGAITTYPRTLFKPSEIPAVRQSLQEATRRDLYFAVYGASSYIPTDNTSTENRRLRARAAKNAAFVRIMNLKPAGGIALDSLSATEKAQVQANVISLLENINTNVRSLFYYTDWQWRSKELIDYLVAYDLLRGAGVPAATMQLSKNKLQEFAGNLYAAGSSNVGTIYNNHMFMTAAALGMAGVVLNDAGSTTASRQPQNWINIGMYNIDNVMWRATQRQSEPGLIAGYAEGPYYFKYSMLNCLPFFRAFGNFLPDGMYSFTWNSTTRQIRNPYHDPNYDLLYQWITDITMPDGRIPALEDSYIDMAMPEMALTGKPQFVKNFNGQNLEPRQPTTLSAQLDGTVDLRANYLAANVDAAPETENNLTSLPASGNLVFRSGTGFQANYLHVYGKNGKPLTNSGGHNHGDAGSFSLYAHGQLLALDAGYLNFNRRAEVGNPTNHNLVLVDGAGPKIGTSGAANDAEAFIQNTFEMPNTSYGEVRTAYNGTNITRKTLSIRGEYYLMADFLSSALPHNFTWQLHGFGAANGTPAQGTFTYNATTSEGIWLKNGVSLRAHITANNGLSSVTTANNIHETTWNLEETHTTLLANKNSVSETQFLATLQPYITRNTVTSTLSLTNMAGSVTVTPQFTDLAFTQTDTLLKVVNAPQLTKPVSSDAYLTFFSVDNNGAFHQAFLQQGKSLSFGPTEILKSTKRANLLLEISPDGKVKGYASKPTTLYFKTDIPPQTVSGAGLSSWTYNANLEVVTLIFSQPSDFQIVRMQQTLPVELVAFKAEKVNQQVRLTWQTASEKNNEAFDLQFSANGKTWETVASIAGQGTTSAAHFYEHLHRPAFSGQLYYRLAQRDLDGTTSFSAIRTIWFEKGNRANLTVYPNPARDFFNLQVDSEIAEKAELEFYNVSGAIVYRQPLNVLPGSNALKVTMPAPLPQGLYQVRFQTAHQQQTFRLQKIR